MRPDDSSNLPPPHLLEAMCQPRRPQVDDARVRELLRRWKALGTPIEYSDLNDVADIIAPGRELRAKTRAKIVAAVEAAGIEINNFDSLREWTASGRAHVSLTGRAMDGIIEESRWLYPYEYDRRVAERPPAREEPEWMKEMRLDWEYGRRPRTAKGWSILDLIT